MWCRRCCCHATVIALHGCHGWCFCTVCDIAVIVASHWCYGCCYCAMHSVVGAVIVPQWCYGHSCCAMCGVAVAVIVPRMVSWMLSLCCSGVVIAVIVLCHRLGMQTNCQHRVAAVTAPSSGAASPTICVLFMILVSVMALVAFPLLSPLVTGHGILAIGMSTMPLLAFDHHYSPLPCFRSEVEPPFLSYCLISSIVSAKRLPTYPVLLLDDGYCL